MIDGQLHLKALFYQMQPETLLASMDREHIHWCTEKEDEIIHTARVSKQAYLHSLRPLEGNRSEDELIQSYLDLKYYLDDKPAGGIFSLLNEYTKNTLSITNGQPEFLQEKALEWREMSLKLGQDLFTCSMLAWQDLYLRKASCDFRWSAVIPTNSPALKQLISRGLAENHYHLNGSTQSFSLTWGFLMNHPEAAKRYFSDSKFKNNLHSEVSLGAKDNHLLWPTRIYLAAWLRAMLFSVSCEKITLTSSLDGMSSFSTTQDLTTRFKVFRESINPRRDVQSLVSRLRLQTGTRFLKLNGKKECLDYAISLSSAEELDSRVRFLTGERRFLYHCFRQCYSKAFSRKMQDLFYLYLLLKAKFRNELIQNNDRYGFRNFSEYQDRKSAIWENWHGYWMEAGRLASAAVQEENVTSLEMRVMPWKDRKQVRTRIELPDQFIHHSPKDILDCRTKRRKRAKEDKRFFYVIHFPKKPLELIAKPDDTFPILRHKKQRSLVRQRAKSLAMGLAQSDYLCSRIRGIDAASHEIGCRPEIFAQAFRYLRGEHPHKSYRPSRPQLTLRATYHVGEDFLDITDGLRAVDEAICFLNLRRGERIGHGLALGIDPKEYYQLKNNVVRLPAQDLLDNLVWIMERSLEWGVHIPSQLFSSLKEQARQLLDEIYPKIDSTTPSFRNYFYSWALRGDNPVRYYTALSKDFSITDDPEKYSLDVYRWFDLNDHIWEGFDIRSCRANSVAVKLNYYYQYDAHVRWNGQRTVHFSINDEYIALIYQIQTRMLQKIMEKGLSIECNPSSNYLIGTFRDYAKHPIFRFNNYGLQLPEYPEKHIQLPVSINTDDLGVFDCSLENEYALLLGALTNRKNIEKRREVSDDEALEYLEHIRHMGFSVAFPHPSEQNVPERRAPISRTKIGPA